MAHITDSLFLYRPRGHARRSGFIARLFAWDGLRRQRKALSELDDHMLNDIGVTRDEARTEAQRPVWDAPENWRL